MALFFQDANSQWYRHMGLLMVVPPPARDQVRLLEADSHLDRHLALYSSEELERFWELQLMPAAREMTKHRLSVGLCVGDGACPSSAVEVGGGGVYLFNRLKEEAEEAVSETLLFLSWIKTAWDHLAILGQIGSLMAFFGDHRICIKAILQIGVVPDLWMAEG